MSSVSQLSSSAIRLLDRDAPEGYLTEWTAHVGAATNTIERGAQSVMIFRVGPEWLALRTIVLQEVCEKGKIHTLPHRGEILRGLVNIRGELLVCVALEVLLGLDSRATTLPHERLLVCNQQGNRVVFPVSEVFGVHRYYPRDLGDIPATLGKAAGGVYTIGLLRWQGRTVGCLDHEILFHTLNKGLA